MTLNIKDLFVTFTKMTLSINDTEHKKGLFVTLCHLAECRYADCPKAEYHYAECHYVECQYAECRYVECQYAECRYDKCQYAECRYDERFGAL
jgi:hypothetical protein